MSAATTNVVDIDDPKPWTIKGVSIEARNAAIAAATRQRMTQGEWLTRNILRMVKAELAEERSPAVIAPIALPAPDPKPDIVLPAWTAFVPDITISDLQVANALLNELGDAPGTKTSKRLLVRQLNVLLGKYAPTPQKPKAQKTPLA